MSAPRYIAIEGPIGAGKTSLANSLAAELGGQLVLEQPDENPFLPLFYAEPDRYALPTQLSFLLARYRQLQALRGEGATPVIISDYSYVKDLIFSELTLEEDELALYRQIYRKLVTELPKPDLIIYLESAPELLKKHVKRRKASYEKKIKLDYLEAVLDAYNRFFFDYNESPLLVVNCTEIDFVKNEAHYQSLLGEIFNKKRAKRHYVALEA